MRTLYFDCFAGASGNMILGGLIACGVDRELLKTELKKLNIADFELAVSTVDRSGISSTHVDVKVEEEHVHRHPADIDKIIRESAFNESVKRRALEIFQRLASAEAAVHGIAVEKVHFHEVGAKDAIIDIVGSCIGFEMLGIERFACSKIHVGSGFVNMVHGKFPVPPPAVAELLKGIPIYSTEIVGELVTPTGAAIISTVCDSYGTIPEMTVENAGYGAGTRTYEDFPNTLRLLIGEAATTNASEPHQTERLALIETNVDDVSPQVLGFVMESAFEIGALDCWFTAIQMKKNRPATMISILCETARTEEFTQLLYSQTTTLGVRINYVERKCLEREIIAVETKFGRIDIKIARSSGKTVNAMPEYDNVKAAALKHGVPFRGVQDEALREFERLANLSTVKR